MSYTDNIPSDQLSEYEIINDWDKYFGDFLEKNTTSTGLRLIYKLEERNKIIESQILFLGTYEFSIRFENCYFKKSFDLPISQFNKGLSFSKCYFDEGITSTPGTIIKDNFFITDVVLKKFLLLGGNFDKCLWSFSDCDQCVLAGGSFEELQFIITEKGIANLHITANDLNGVIKILGANSFINNVLVRNFSNKLVLSLEDLHVNKINILDYRNESGLRLSNIIAQGVNSEFTLNKSYLGKSEFYLIDFTKFDLVNIVDSHIVDSIFVNITWTKKIDAFQGQLEEESENQKILKNKITVLQTNAYKNIRQKNELKNDREVLRYFSKKRETLRQLKYALSKQGDTINEQKFHALEMTSYNYTLSWRRNFWTKFIIWFSHTFSDFGQSISKPLFGLLIGHFVLFSTLVLCGVLAPLHFSIRYSTTEGFWRGFNQYFVLINPFRKSDETFQGGFIIIDLIMRIWASYMVYNIIRASRRFIK